MRAAAFDSTVSGAYTGPTPTRRIVLGHHDDWLPGFSIPTDLKPIREELARVVPNCELLEPGYLDGSEILPLPRRR